VISTILKCTILTEASLIGAFLMFSYDIPTTEGFVIWGCVLAAILILGYLFGALEFIKSPGDESVEPNAVFFILLLNGIMINFGGYLILMLVLRIQYGFPLSIGGL
jgi:hypothetical protein